MLAAYLHQIDPFAIRFWDGFGVRWYGLSYVAGFVAAYLLIRWLARRGATVLAPGRVGDFVLTVAVGTVIGGRLGYCLFYQPDLLVRFTSEVPFWGLLAIDEGGMASHGGMLGIVAACVWFAVRHGGPALHYLDLTAWTSTVGVFFGRIANFVNGELIGRRCEPGLPWAVKFPQEIRGWVRADHPKHELLASEQFLDVQRIVQRVSESAIREPARMYEKIIEMSRSNEQVAAALRPLLTPRHPSQLYEALLEGLLLFALLTVVWARPRKPGVVAGWFLIGYGVVRIVGEVFRLPDAHIGFDWLGLTRGQWLSVAMLAAGALCLTWWSRRPVSRIGGWRTGMVT